MRSRKIFVVGSTNIDMVVRTTHIPVPGETVLGGAFFMNPGGKGANQAVSVARLGGEIVFVSKIGKDIFGQQSFRLLENEHMDVRYIRQDGERPSGVALITVDQNGENSIVVAPGANAGLSPSDLEPALPEIAAADSLLLQLEIPLTTVDYITRYASEEGVRVILNPAPAAMLPPGLLQHIDILTPNKKEASILSGIDVTDLESAKAAAKAIRDQGVKSVVITLGAAGALILEKDVFHNVPSMKVETVDSTAAGDVFNGALAVALAEGRNLVESVGFACQAAAISVTRPGAQSSIPYRRELSERKKTNP